MKMSNSLYTLIISLVLMIYPIIVLVDKIIDFKFGTGHITDSFYEVSIFFVLLSIYFLIDEKLNND